MFFSLNKKTYIFFFFIIYLFIFSKGSISGDYEKIFDISQKFLNSDLSLVNFISNYQNKSNFLFFNEDTFFKHNFVFFLVDVLIIKFLEFIPYFQGYNYLIEFITASIPGTLFFISVLLIYNCYKNKFDRNFLIFAIIFFYFGTYLVNFFSSSAFAESYIFFLLSLRFYLIEKNKGNFFIPIIDAFLIQIRITCWVLMPFFLYTYFKHKNFSLKNVFQYFVILLILIIFFKILLNPVALESYYIEKIVASFCSDNILQIITTYIERLIQTFFSYSLGIFFIFPIFIFVLISYAFNFKTEDIIKIISLFFLIGLFALEEYWFLPAGISGNRGIAPFLLFLFPNFVNGFKFVFLKFPKISFGVAFLSLILFLPSIYFRTTIGTYAICGQLDGCSIPFRDAVNNEIKYTDYKGEKVKCRLDNSFAVFNFNMHPSIYSYRIFNNIILEKKVTKVNLVENRFYEIDTNYVVPETIGARIMFILKNNLKLIDQNKINFKNYISKYANELSLIIFIFKIITFVSLFILLFKKFKILQKDFI